MIDPTLRDAELRVIFAEQYLLEVEKESRLCPSAWKEQLENARYGLQVAKSIHARVLRNTRAMEQPENILIRVSAGGLSG